MNEFSSIILRMVIGGYLIYLGKGLLTGSASESNYHMIFFCIGLGFALFGFLVIITGIKEIITIMLGKKKNSPRQEGQDDPSVRDEKDGAKEESKEPQEPGEA